mgnify:CR=1 FL=1
MAAIVAALRCARRIVVFTGAGLSADSGIPTFRDGATGLWAGVDPDEVASLDGFDRNPDKVWAWHEAMRALFAQAEPNAGHHGIAALARRLPEALVTVITQLFISSFSSNESTGLPAVPDGSPSSLHFFFSSMIYAYTLCLALLLLRFISSMNFSACCTESARIIRASKRERLTVR